MGGVAFALGALIHGEWEDVWWENIDGEQTSRHCTQLGRSADYWRSNGVAPSLGLYITRQSIPYPQSTHWCIRLCSAALWCRKWGTFSKLMSTAMTKSDMAWSCTNLDNISTVISQTSDLLLRTPQLRCSHSVNNQLIVSWGTRWLSGELRETWPEETRVRGSMLIVTAL